MKNNILYTLVGIAILCLSAGCRKDDKKAGEEMPPMTVDVAEVVVDSVMVYRDYPGRLQANSVTDIVCKVDGKLLTKNFNDGDFIEKGTLLYTIDDSPYRDAVQQARGELEQARSTTEYYKKDYEKIKSAYEKDAAAEIEVLQAESQYKAGLANITSYEASLKSAETNLGYCRITAPVTGRIADSSQQPGAYISGSAAPYKLTTMYDNSVFYVEFHVDDNTFYHIAGNNASEVKDGYTMIPLKFSEPLQNEYIGNFSYVSPSISKTTGTMVMRAEIKNEHDELRDGMDVTISLPFENDPQAMLVEDAAIGTDQQGKYVYVVNDKNEVVYTPVKVGELVSDNRRIVKEGLKPGQKYVTKAMLKVQNGTKVKPVLKK